MGPSLETNPEGWTGYQGGAPMSADVNGHDQNPVVGPTFEDSQQYLWWKFVDGYAHVPDHPGLPQNCREILFDVRDL